MASHPSAAIRQRLSFDMGIAFANHHLAVHKKNPRILKELRDLSIGRVWKGEKDCKGAEITGG